MTPPSRKDPTSEPVAVIVRFNGDPDDLFERFDRARRLWIEAQDSNYERPVFYAACKTADGITIVNCWKTQADHAAFGRRMGPHLHAVGVGHPHTHEHLSIQKLGWD
jgi:hypothetical protein